MSARFTPGPWRVGDGGATIFGPKRADGLPPRIIAILSKGLAVDATRANARLMAEAPAMADILRQLVADQPTYAATIGTSAILARIEGAQS